MAIQHRQEFIEIIARNTRETKKTLDCDSAVWFSSFPWIKEVKDYKALLTWLGTKILTYQKQENFFQTV